MIKVKAKLEGAENTQSGPGSVGPDPVSPDPVSPVLAGSDSACPKLVCIGAVARNGVIGQQGDLPWRLKADLQRFRRETMGHHMIMGRKTWESIGRPLPGRTSWVLSRRGIELPSGVHRLGAVQEIEALCSGELAAQLAGEDPPFGEDGVEKKVFCIGGAELYSIALPMATGLLLTRVEADVDGDVFFPEIDWNNWTVLDREELAADEDNEFPTTFLRCRRVALREDPGPSNTR